MRKYYSIVRPIFLILLGLVIWFSKIGLISIDWRRDWPLIIVAIGIIQIISVIFKKM